MNTRPHARKSWSLAAALAAVAVPFLPPPAPAGTELAAAHPGDAAPGSAARVHYRNVDVDGVRVFYREAGPTDAPVVLLLHGFPASSFMYRDLIDGLAGELHVIAPDYPGFGHSEAPSTADFSYTFDRLADVMEQFIERLGLDRFALYLQDFGGPVGFRVASRSPEKVTSLVIQNANAYEEGLPESFWATPRILWEDPSAANFAKIRELAMSDEALEWNYTHGVKDPERINPDSWVLQRALLNRPGNKEAMLSLLYDYRTNPGLYPGWQEYFRTQQPPTLIVWGKNDEIFPADGARAYLRDLPEAEMHLLDTGHFALEDRSNEIARLVLDFLQRKLCRVGESAVYRSCMPEERMLP